MKKIMLGLILVLTINSCKKDNVDVENQNTQVEIEFVKEGKLSLINENGEPFKNLTIEIADTDYERSRGLMDRSKLDENQGMLFIFDEVKKHTFYMKNTRIPLDIIYLDSDSTVINIAKMAMPGEDSGQGVGFVAPAKEDSKFVLEINGGLSDAWGIKEGVTKINFKKIK